MGKFPGAHGGSCRGGQPGRRIPPRVPLLALPFHPTGPGPSVQKECQVLLNFTSLDAILSALWSNSIQHLKQTWKEVSRDSIDHLEMMSKTSQKRELPGQPTVPDLWTLLSELASLQLAPTDSREGRLRNYDIGLKEYKVIPRIERLQAGCIYIYFRPTEEFRAWFGAVEQLSASECFHLSCEREPPALSASNILDAPNLPEAGKPRSTGLQELSAEPSCSSASLPSVWLQLGRDRSSGVTAVSLPGHEADASKSDQEMSVGLISKCPDGQEEQIDDSTFKSDHPQPGAPLSAHRASSPLQFYRKQITCHDRAPAVILKALDEYHLDLEAAKEYKLVQIISPDRRLIIPDDSNVFDAMDPSGNYHLVLTKLTFRMVKKRTRSTLFHRKKTGGQGAASKWP
ncbi:ral guanine nucleotide dissociation stimulator-like isoform X5 [Tamandua tetradactyla]|uniref:ral guanine nucleotide dissociation stimulator-like isoform X5 n=1 Tax=Tamandua tetradactyla TaxID=48850 RepID=UPI0040541BBD